MTVCWLIQSRICNLQLLYRTFAKNLDAQAYYQNLSKLVLFTSHFSPSTMASDRACVGERVTKNLACHKIAHVYHWISAAFNCGDPCCYAGARWGWMVPGGAQFPGQDGLAPPCSNLRSFGSCTEERTCDIVGDFQQPRQSFGAPVVTRSPGNCAPLLPLVTPLLLRRYQKRRFLTESHVLMFLLYPWSLIMLPQGETNC